MGDVSAQFEGYGGLMVGPGGRWVRQGGQGGRGSSSGRARGRGCAVYMCICVREHKGRNTQNLQRKVCHVMLNVLRPPHERLPPPPPSSPPPDAYGDGHHQGPSGGHDERVSGRE